MPEADVDVHDPVEAVKQFRSDLLNAGFRHANELGELVSRDNTTWVSTTYTHGEYSVYAWRRESGHGELNETATRVVVRVTPRTDPKTLEKAKRALIRNWAKRPRKGVVWPPAGMVPLR